MAVVLLEAVEFLEGVRGAKWGGGVEGGDEEGGWGREGGVWDLFQGVGLGLGLGGGKEAFCAMRQAK